MTPFENTGAFSQSEAFTVSGFGGFMHTSTLQECREAVRKQLLEDTIFRIFVYRTSYTDIRTGEGIYLVVDEKTVLTEEWGVCQGLLARLLPELSLTPKEPLPSSIVLFQERVQRSRTNNDMKLVTPPRDDLEEERRCRLLQAFPNSGDYSMIALFVEVLDVCVHTLQREGIPVTASAIEQRTHFHPDVIHVFLTIVAEQHERVHVRTHEEKHI